jgi:hypothetical protein
MEVAFLTKLLNLAFLKGVAQCSEELEAENSGKL